MYRILFRSLWNVGLDRKHLSIHEMLVDILEVVEVAEGLKPAHLAHAGDGQAWRSDGFERAVIDAGLHTLRTPEMRAPAQRYAAMAGEFPLISAALQARATQAPLP